MTVKSASTFVVLFANGVFFYYLSITKLAYRHSCEKVHTLGSVSEALCIFPLIRSWIDVGSICPWYNEHFIHWICKKPPYLTQTGPLFTGTMPTERKLYHGCCNYSKCIFLFLLGALPSFSFLRCRGVHMYIIFRGMITSILHY